MYDFVLDVFPHIRFIDLYHDEIEHSVCDQLDDIAVFVL
jgi:hypothetical protein